MTSNHSPSPAFHLAVAVWCLVIIAAAVLLLVVMTQTVLTTPIPFDIDESNHALDGWEVYYSLINRSPSGLLRAVSDQAFYPPVFSFFVASAYLLVGPGLFASRIPSVFNYALLIIALTGLTFYFARRAQMEREHKGEDVENHSSTGRFAIPGIELALIGAFFATALTITSMTMIRNAVLSMLEITGALLVIPLFVLVERADQRSGPSRMTALLLAAVMVMILFLTKYTFGMFFGAALAAALVSKTWPWKTSRRAWYELLAITGIFALIASLWVILTDRESMSLFFTGHPSYVPFWSWENFLFYPRIWINEYSITAFIGVFVTILAAVEAVLNWQKLYARLAAWSVLIALVILTISTTNEPRHILVVAPAIWLLAGLRLATIFRALLQEASWGPKASLAVALLLILFLEAGIPAAERVHQEMVTSFEGEPFFSAMQAVALEEVDLEQPVLVIGDTNDQFNLLALRWRAALETNQSTWQLDIDRYPFDQFDWILARHNRKPQIKEIDEDFLDGSLDEVLDQRYYSSVIAVRNNRRKSELVTEALVVLESFPAVTYKYPGWEITVYKLH